MPGNNGFKNYSAICAIAKDEDSSLEDWANHHFAIGFEKIHIFDNNSRTPIRETLADHVRAGIVAVYELDMAEAQQMTAYASFLKKLGGSSRWVAFIDIDEFICPKSCSDIGEFLSGYEDHPAIGVNWKIFSSNGHVSKPGTSDAEAYTAAIQNHGLIKSIVQPAMTLAPLSPHHFSYKNDRPCVNEHFMPIHGSRSYHSSEKIQINHYYFRSQQDFEEKIQRGFATALDSRDGYDLEEFYRQAQNPGWTDRSATRFAKKAGFYTRMGPEFIAGEIRKKTRVDTARLLESALEKLTSGKVDQARRELSSALLHSRDPLLHVALAKICVLEKNLADALDNMSRALFLARDNEPLRKGIYRELAEIYKAFGYGGQSEAIIREL